MPNHFKIHAKEAKSLMLEVCAEYMSMTEAQRASTGISSPKDFAKRNIKHAVDCFADGKMDIQSFLFFCKLYGLFFKNFTLGTSEEKMRFNLEQLEDGKMEPCIVCLSRLEEEWDSVEAEL